MSEKIVEFVFDECSPITLRNIPSNSSCRFHNTLVSLQDCQEHIFDSDLSEEENEARKRLIHTCYKVIQNFLTDDLKLDKETVDNINHRFS